MRIKMLVNVRPELPFLAKPGTILRAGMEYEATANPNAAICGICENGVAMGVRPGEFVFMEAPAWVLNAWAAVWPEAALTVDIPPSNGDKTYVRRS